jgi:hypothetical protein
MFKRKVQAAYTVVVADFKSVTEKFLKQGASKDDIDTYIQKFKSLRDKQKIKDLQDKNIDNWGKKEFKEFKKFVDSLEGDTSTRIERKLKKESHEGADLIAENDEWLVYKIKSHDACMFYGKGTKWCITEEDGEHWSEYNKNGDFYYIISKKKNPRDPLAKIAMFVEEEEEDFVQWFDAEDKLLKGSSGWETWYGKKSDETLPPTVPKFEIKPTSIWEKVKYQKDINVSAAGLTSLEGAPKEVGGYFDCSFNKLTSLEGAPEKVGGKFDCSRNVLTSLAGAPKEVGGIFGIFNCSSNKLTSLEGAPSKVGGFYCYKNKLTSLEGAPEKVGGDFFCSSNNLTSLAGAPQKVGGDFRCYHNNLRTLEGAPVKVGGDFNCSFNKLTSLEGAPKEVGGNFNCKDNAKKFTEKEVRSVCNVKGKVYV